MSGENIFQKLFSSLFHSNDADAEKKRQLKAIAKNLSKQRYKFYKPQSSQVLPGYANFLFDIYKLVGPLQAMFNGIKNPNTYKNWVITSVLTPEQHTMYEELSEEAILEAAKQQDLSAVVASTRQKLNAFTSSFTQEIVDSMDSTYNTLMLLQSFSNYDYFFTLKKFYSSLRENDFNITPKFEALDAEYLTDDLKDFAVLFVSIPLEAQAWTEVFAIIKEHKGFDPIPANQWNKLLNRCRDIKLNNVIDMMIQLITDNPSYVTAYRERGEHIADSFVDKLRNDTDALLRKLQSEQSLSKNNSLLTQIFGSTDIVRLKYYNEAGNEMFAKRGIPGYSLYKPLNYLKAFLLDYVKKDVRDYCELVLVRGKWIATQQASQMSDAYNNIIQAAEKVSAFDETLADGQELNTKMKSYCLRADRDMEARKVVQTLLNDVNTEARDLIVKATQQLVIIGRYTKSLLEDYEKPTKELLMNWKELEHFSDGSIKEQGVALYKKVYLFVQLMQMNLKGPGAE
ncbi:MAG: hypothetical protein KBT02_10730 [Treponema sp.]|nr:hypothetical protein [Candidatus Treponema caballi]